MNRLAVLATAVPFTLSVASCSYAHNRLADLKDAFTATVGVGIGFGAHIGPVGTGLGMVIDGYGMRAGCTGKNDPGHFSSGFDLELVAVGFEEGWKNLVSRDRAKAYGAKSYVLVFPEYEPGRRGLPVIPPRFTELEVSIGLGG